MVESMIALLVTVLGAGSLFLATRESGAGGLTPKWLRALAYILFVSIAFAMFQHLVPGFHNILVFDKVKFTPDALPFTMYLNFDKTIVGLLLLIFYVRKNERGQFTFVELRTVAMMAGLLIGIFVPLATIVGFVRFEPKIPELAWAWALNNLFLVCFAEEMLFRRIPAKWTAKAC